MANFKDSYRLERVYFEKLKSMISILKSFLENETDEKTRAILSNEIDDNGAILLLYRNLGEAWAELADLIQKLRNDLNDLDEKEEAYHDELNERIDEVNNYLMALIRALEARMDAVEADLAQMGRLFTYDLTETSGVYSLTESGAAVTFADTVSKLTHVRPHFVSVRNGSKYYLIDTYDLTAGTGSVTWSGFEFTPTGEIKETIVTLAADNSVTVTQTATDFSSILSRITALEEGKQDKLTAGENITIQNNVISSTAQGAYIITERFNSQRSEYEFYHNNSLLSIEDLADLADNAPSDILVYNEAEQSYYRVVKLSKSGNYLSFIFECYVQTDSNFMIENKIYTETYLYNYSGNTWTKEEGAAPGGVIPAYIITLTKTDGDYIHGSVDWDGNYYYFAGPSGYQSGGAWQRPNELMKTQVLAIRENVPSGYDTYINCRVEKVYVPQNPAEYQNYIEFDIVDPDSHDTGIFRIYPDDSIAFIGVRP